MKRLHPTSLPWLAGGVWRLWIIRHETSGKCYAALTVSLMEIHGWGRRALVEPAGKGSSMKTKVGLWIDHRKAIVVAITDKGEQRGLIISAIERQARRSPRSRSKGPFEPQHVPADDNRQRALTGHLNIYYDAVIASVRDAQSILILGPGEAKGELKRRLARIGLGARIVGIETFDKMTDRQIAAMVRQHFAEKLLEKGPGKRKALLRPVAKPED